GWSPASFRRCRLREQPLGSHLAGALLEVGEQAAHLMELRAQLLDAPELGRDRRERAGGVLVETAEATLARLELAADRARPRFRLFLQRAELALGRGSFVEHLAEPFDQGEIERVRHLGGRAILSDVPPLRWARKAGSDPAGQ